MTATMTALLLFATLALGLHLASIGLALFRVTRRPPAAAVRPPITILRPVCGIDNHALATLRSGFEIDFPVYEQIFCVASAEDPVIALIERVRVEYPDRASRLIVGDAKVSGNPKLNNLVRGWDAAAYEMILMSDSNVLCPRDYLDRLMAAWRPGTGLVTAPPIGCMADNLWAELECAWLNTYEARWQMAADTVGLGFAQGKNLFWRRADLERAGGIAVLGRDPAEDAAATKTVREAGLRVRMVDRPFGQPLGSRSLAEVWKRQVRWARLRRMTFKAFFLPELLSGALPPLLALALVEPSWMLPFLIVWYGTEALLARMAGWQLTWRSLPMWLLRDLLLPVQWCLAWSGRDLEWRNSAVPLRVTAPGGTRQSL